MRRRPAEPHTRAARGRGDEKIRLGLQLIRFHPVGPGSLARLDQLLHLGRVGLYTDVPRPALFSPPAGPPQIIERYAGQELTRWPDACAREDLPPPLNHGIEWHIGPSVSEAGHAVEDKEPIRQVRHGIHTSFFDLMRRMNMHV